MIRKICVLLLVIFISCDIGTDTLNYEVKTKEEIRIFESGVLQGKEKSIFVGNTKSLLAKHYRDGVESNITDFNWLSTDSQIVSVTMSGKITAKKKGQARITALHNNASAEILITVVENTQQLAKILLTDPQKSIYSVGDTVLVTAKGYTINDIEISNLKFTWVLSDTALASVDSNGTVIFKKEGSVSLKAKSGGIESTDLSFDIIDINRMRQGMIIPVSHGNSHKGTVTLKYENGMLVLVLGSDFQTVSGPDLHVTLASKQSVYSPGDKDLGLLKSISGEQKYTVGNETKIDDFQYVQIWCKQANSVFCSAKLN